MKGVAYGAKETSSGAGEKKGPTTVWGEEKKRPQSNSGGGGDVLPRNPKNEGGARRTQTPVKKMRRGKGDTATKGRGKTKKRDAVEKRSQSRVIGEGV